MAHVLVVDDEPDLALLVQINLERLFAVRRSGDLDELLRG